MTEPPTLRVALIFQQLKELNLDELRWLKAAYLDSLGEDEEGGVGVREPRRPSPESPGDEIAIELAGN